MRQLPKGHSDFKKIRQEQLYYVDKSLLIEEIIADKTEIILLPRPRRFGKTLNLSLLKYFPFFQVDAIFKKLGCSQTMKRASQIKRYVSLIL